MTEHHNDDTNRALVRMIDALTETIRDLHLHRRLDIIIQGQQTLMANFDQLASAVNAFMSTQSAQVDILVANSTTASAALTGIAGDLDHLDELIQQLIDQGSLTPAQQALADEMIASLGAASTRLDAATTASTAVATNAAALDAMRPPVVPPTP